MNGDLLVLENRIQIFGRNSASEMSADKDRVKNVIDFVGGFSRIPIEFRVQYICVDTIAAAGSETSKGSVITNEKMRRSFMRIRITMRHAPR